MRKINNWANIKPQAEYSPLPAGGYVCRIMGAEMKTYDGRNGELIEKLAISLDIAEGDHKDHFADDYRGQTFEDKRWGCVLSLSYPPEDAPETDWRYGVLKAAVEAIEESNPGYHFDWDERKLKGKTVGCLFRSEEWEYNGKSGWKVRPFKLLDAQRVREGKFTQPKEKPLKKATNANYNETASEFEAVDVDSDLPF